ncbi:MAG: cupin domain-containing protein [bacterium]|nr:cupin domain-containing protein [bacterium]
MQQTEPTVIRLDEREKVPFSPDSYYQPILNSDVGDFPIFTGIQTAEPGYQTRPHAHPYTEILHILEGEAEAWLVDQADKKILLKAGDTIVLPANRPHVFRVAGEQNLRLLGTHISPKRIVNYTDGNTVVMT